ncbi:MAG: hypothetical protein K2M55_09395, partial [Muribaculaceae bacterium]|nr:hypothetical protein [Muribaculaceae bacterium]
ILSILPDFFGQTCVGCSKVMAKIINIPCSVQISAQFLDFLTATTRGESFIACRRIVRLSKWQN